MKKKPDLRRVLMSLGGVTVCAVAVGMFKMAALGWIRSRA